jgi:dihydroxy-acid dehydratase
MVRISDARMSGTAYGTVILHVSPDAASGGTLGLVRGGDRIRLSVAQRSLDLLVDDRELARRRSNKVVHRRPASRGYQRLYDAHILQADEGCDFGFLQALK